MRDSRVIPLRPVPANDDALIELTDVHVAQAGRKLLRGVNLKLGRHGITGLIGPNGAGKSLILRVLAGLIRPASGTVVLPDALGAPALVFQRPVLLRRTARANLAHALKVAGVPRTERPGRVAELLVQTSLTQQSEDPARSLSGGEQQRLQIARALTASPKCLLLDEPTASLDPASTAVIESLIRRIADDGVRIVLVTHDHAQAARLAHDIAFLSKGTILEHRQANDFFAHPQSVEARAFLDGKLLV